MTPTTPAAQMRGLIGEVKLAFVNANPLIRHQIGHVVVPMMALLEQLVNELEALSERQGVSHG